MAADLGAAIVAGVRGVADRLIAAGIPTAVNVGEVETPGAFISSAALELDRMDGGGTLTVRIYLVAPDNDETTALTVLGGLLSKAVAVARPNTAGAQGEPIDTNSALSLAGTTVPAFRYSTDILI